MSIPAFGRTWIEFFSNWDGNSLLQGGEALKTRMAVNWDVFRLNYAIVCLFTVIAFSMLGVGRSGAVIMGLMTVAWHMMIRLTPAEAEEMARLDAEDEKKEADRLEKLYGPVKKDE